jgi:hypothetical protein
MHTYCPYTGDRNILTSWNSSRHEKPIHLCLHVGENCEYVGLVQQNGPRDMKNNKMVAERNSTTACKMTNRCCVN